MGAVREWDTCRLVAKEPSPRRRGWQGRDAVLAFSSVLFLQHTTTQALLYMFSSCYYDNDCLECYP